MGPQPDVLMRLQAALAERYTIERELGRGGMATVYLARDRKHDRAVALKVLKPDLAAAIGPDRFLREITLTARLDHPHILPLLDSGEADGFLYYVMPYVEGESLRDRLNREKQLPLDDALQIAREAADALGYAHSRGIVHRDIKPENILLAGGHARVADFGIARAFSEAGGESLTGTGLAIGTPAYMSPEQAAGSKNLDGRSDLYSLGCVLYEMLLGDPPFAGWNAQAILARKSVEAPPPLRSVRETIPEHVERAALRLLARAPADRFPTTERFVADLDRGASTAGPAPMQRRRRAPRTLALLVVGAVATAAALWITMGLQSSRPDTLAPHRIAVFPFDLHAGPDLAYLAEGMMELLSDAIDGTGELRRVDPYALMSRIRESEDPVPVTHERARQITRQFGAGRFVSGGVWDVGGRIRIAASLFDAREEGTEPVARASATGAERDLPLLLDSVATRLLAGIAVGGGRLKDVTSIRAANFQALKAYLEGERFLLLGWFDSAGPRLREAVQRDSTFALAWYRLSIAQGWGAGGSTLTSIDNAVRHRENLGRRDRLLVEASHASRHGDGRLAERLAQEVTGAYPDDAEGWHLLGFVRNSYAWQGTGSSPGTDAMDRALALDSSNPVLVAHRMGSAVVDGDFSLAATLLRRAPRGGGAGPVVKAHEICHAVHRSGSYERSRILAEGRAADDWTLWNVGWCLALTDSLRWAEDFWRLLAEDRSRSRGDVARGQLSLALLDVARGRWHAAHRAFEGVDSSITTLATTYQAWFAAMPFFDRPRGELARLRDAVVVLRLPPVESAESDYVGFGVPKELHSRLPEYLTGLLAARLGDTTAALRVAVALEGLAGEDPVHLLADLAIEIRAAVAFERGEFETVLALLDRMRLRAALRGDAMSPFHRRDWGRFFRVETLARLGRFDEAVDPSGPAANRGFLDQRWGTGYVLHAPIWLRMGEAAEQRGDSERAISFYGHFLARWDDPDPEYAPLVRDVRARVERLKRGRG